MTAPRWEVQTLIVNDWENVWTCDDEPVTFASHYEADAELADHLRDCRIAFDAGDLDDMPDRDTFRIVKCMEGER